MNLSTTLAKQIREVLLNGKWISTNLKTQISELNWEQATSKIGSCNTIAALTFHINYYIAGVNNFLENGSLDIHDKYSFDMPPIESQEDWEALMAKSYKDAEKMALLIEQLSDEKLGEYFVKEAYGTYYRNLVGMVEHSYYHLGQVVLLKKLIQEGFSS